MFKKRLFIFAILIISVLLFSCGDDDLTGPGTNELVGIWEAETNTIYSGSISNPDSKVEFTFDKHVHATLTFKDDNTFTLDIFFFGQTENSSGTWSVSGNKITFKEPGEPEGTDEFSISGNKLTLTESETVDGYTTFDVTVFTRQ